MVTKRKRKERVDLQSYKLVFRNVKNHPELEMLLADCGYPEEVMAEGKALYERSVEAYDSSSRKNIAQGRAYIQFNSAWTKLRKMYSLHRETARVVFRRDDQTAIRLHLASAKPRDYLGLLEEIKNFYSILSDSSELTATMGRYGTSSDEIVRGLELYGKVVELRSAYMLAKGEKQDATDKKNAALMEIDEWMRDFFAMAKIATRNDPQLLEAFGKVVKSK